MLKRKYLVNGLFLITILITSFILISHKSIIANSTPNEEMIKSKIQNFSKENINLKKLVDINKNEYLTITDNDIILYSR